MVDKKDDWLSLLYMPAVSMGMNALLPTMGLIANTNPHPLFMKFLIKSAESGALAGLMGGTFAALGYKLSSPEGIIRKHKYAAAIALAIPFYPLAMSIVHPPATAISDFFIGTLFRGIIQSLSALAIVGGSKYLWKIFRHDNNRQ